MTSRTPPMPRTFSIQTLGCKVNQYEAEQLAALLRARGLAPAAAGQAADLRVVHTCSVTVEAASKSRQSVRRAVAGGMPAGAFPGDGTPAGGRSAGVALPVLTVPQTSPNIPVSAGPQTAARVVVTGCWATSDPAAARAIPGVDAVLTHHGDVAAELDALLADWRPRPPADPAAGHRAATPPAAAHPTPTHSTSTHLAAGQRPADHRTGERREAVANRGRDGGWDTSAGTPAGDVTPVSKLPPAAGVNVKIGPPSTPQALDGSGPPAGSSVAPERIGSVPRRRPPATAVGTSGLPLLHDHQTGRQRALLKVQDGCDAHCTYCIIPKLRPGVRSKPVDAAVAEAARLVAGGHVELVLTGIFLGAYGHPTALRRRQSPPLAAVRMKDEGGGMNAEGTAREAPTASSPASPSSFIPPPSSLPLAALVDALCTRVPGLRRVRLSSLEPGDLTDDLVAVLRSHPQVVPHFHLPLQSGSDAILRRMNRQYGRDDFLRMLDRVRAAFDRPALTTDVIVGFPGETDAEFARTTEVVDRAGFIHVHAFGFSPRPGTAAARWGTDAVRGPVVDERIAALREAADRHSLAFRRSFVGRTVELLVEREKGAGRAPAGRVPAAGSPAASPTRHGRSERYFPVWFDDPSAAPGDFARVRVDTVTPTRTHGTRVG